MLRRKGHTYKEIEGAIWKENKAFANCCLFAISRELIRNHYYSQCRKLCYFSIVCLKRYNHESTEIAFIYVVCVQAYISSKTRTLLIYIFVWLLAINLRFISMGWGYLFSLFITFGISCAIHLGVFVTHHKNWSINFSHSVTYKC